MQIRFLNTEVKSSETSKSVDSAPEGLGTVQKTQQYLTMGFTSFIAKEFFDCNHRFYQILRSRCAIDSATGRSEGGAEGVGVLNETF